jgi:DNA-directed RNA polymerase II subunit RPB2
MSSDSYDTLDVPRQISNDLSENETYSGRIGQDTLPVSASGKLLRKYLLEEGIGSAHISAFNMWINTFARNTICTPTCAVGKRGYISFENLIIFPPRYTREGKVLTLTPKYSREQGVTYGGDWHVDIVFRENGTQTEINRVRSICIGNVPTMLKSERCCLHNKSADQMRLLGEDPTDPGAYFIINGAEKVVLLQEQLAINRIFIMYMKSKGNPVARMTCNTPRGTTVVEMILDKKTSTFIKMKFNSLRDLLDITDRNKKKYSKDTLVKAKTFRTLNVLRIYRVLLGLRDPEQIKAEISKFIKPEQRHKCMLKLTSGIIDFLNRTDDIELMATKMGKRIATYDEKVTAVMAVFDNDLFPHLNNLIGPNGETIQERQLRIITAKCNLLSIMIARYLEKLAGFREADDRDSWSNKRVEGGARLMDQLLRTAWGKIRMMAEAFIKNNGNASLVAVADKFKTNIITNSFRDSFITTKWGVKGKKTKENVARTLSRDGIIATTADINTVNVGISRTDRQTSLRLVQPSQWGLICPVMSPEGKNCGLIKNLALTAKVSLERDDTLIIRALIGENNDGPVKSQATDDKHPDFIMVNGKFLGGGDGGHISKFLRSLRRTNALYTDMSIIFIDRWLYVDISPSRIIRPVLIVNETQQLVMVEKNLQNSSIHDLVINGAIEYISAWEQEYIKVATSFKQIEERRRLFDDAANTVVDLTSLLERVKGGEQIENGDTDPLNPTASPTYISIADAQERLIEAHRDLVELTRKKSPYTHCELDEKSILSIVAALIPWPNHNQSPRNTYQGSMAKQALGEYHSNHINRFDGKTKLLISATRPLVENEIYGAIGLDDMPNGCNVIMAFCAYPYTEEDSFVFKRDYLERGGFRLYKYITYSTKVYSYNEKLAKPELNARDKPERADQHKYIYGSADPDDPMNGLPMIGAPLRYGDCVIGKVKVENGVRKNASIYLKIGDEGVVDKVLVTTDNKDLTVSVKLRIMRQPQKGDKFAPRNAQKGTIGIVIPGIDIFYNSWGEIPTIITNPSAIPSRMTLSYFLEVHSSKAAALSGTRVNGGAHSPYNQQWCRDVLKRYGREEFGYEDVRSGLRGQKFSKAIFMGLVFFQALRHHVLDKEQYRSTGQMHPMTRQPIKGRGNKGGLRFGEMERDALLAYGASASLRQMLMLSSDAYPATFCTNCGSFATIFKKVLCVTCGNNNIDQFGTCIVPYVYKLLTQLLAPMGIFLRPEFVTREQYTEDVLSGHKYTNPAKMRLITDLEEEELEQIDQEEQEEVEDTNFEDVYDEM